MPKKRAIGLIRGEGRSTRSRGQGRYISGGRYSLVKNEVEKKLVPSTDQVL